MIRIWVPGKAVQQGSHQAFASKSTGRMVYKPMAKGLYAWRDDIKAAVRDVLDPAGPTTMLTRGQYPLWTKDVAVFLELLVYLAPPKTMPKGRVWPTVTPDVDKLARAVLDALKGVLYADDAQVVRLHVLKSYARGDTRPGLTIHARAIESPEEDA